MLRLVVPLIAGIALAQAVVVPWWISAVACFVLGIGAIVFHGQWALFFMVVSAGFTAGQWRMEPSSLPFKTPMDLMVTIETVPIDRPRGQRAEGRVEAWRDPEISEWIACSERVVIYADSTVELNGADRLVVHASIRPFGAKNPSYARLMYGRGYAGTIGINRAKVYDIQHTAPSSLHASAVDAVERLDLKPRNRAVAQAMLTGERAGLTPAIRTTYSRSGFAHLLAVSGLHTGIIFLVINLLLWWLPLLSRGHIVRNVVAIGAIWIYVAMVGAAPSVVRSAIMYSILQFSLAEGSEYQSLNALGGAAMLMLLWDARWLGDLSFQLSFISVGAIIAWGIPLCRALKTRWRWVNLLVSSLVISAVASLATAPLVSLRFGIIPVAGIVLNPIAIAITTLIVGVGIAWLLLPFSALAGIFGWALDALCGAVNALADFTSAIPFGRIDYALPPQAVDALYLIFAVATLALWCKDRKKALPLYP